MKKIFLTTVLLFGFALVGCSSFHKGACCSHHSNSECANPEVSKGECHKMASCPHHAHKCGSCDKAKGECGDCKKAMNGASKEECPIDTKTAPSVTPKADSPETPKK
jgi:hypothetical protein